MRSRAPVHVTRRDTVVTGKLYFICLDVESNATSPDSARIMLCSMRPLDHLWAAKLKNSPEIGPRLRTGLSN